MTAARPRLAVAVLGDVGRSPRMQYHALALADRIGDVELIGLAGSEPLRAVRDHQHIHLQSLPDRSAGLRARGLGGAAGRGVATSRSVAAAAGRATLVGRGLRAARQAGALWRALVDSPPLDAILVQNPPAVPTLAVALLAARRHRAGLIVDWHNLAYAMLALRVGAGHPLVQLAARYERSFARRAAAHLCVSRAMQAALAERWAIAATVVPDRPAARFAPLTAAARVAARHALYGDVGVGGRPALIVTATSWSADEDFDLLLDAVARYEARGDPASSLLVVITGDGPRRAAYEARIAELPRRRVRVTTTWLPPEDYPRLLAAADLGLCLHRSASGLDLPMKIADMLGAGLPVLALDYGTCLREMIEPGTTALLFSTAAELSDRLHELFAGFPAQTPELDALRANLSTRVSERWEDAWDTHARPVFEAVLARRMTAER
jgi:beta-1,4-mannosyltransferase